MKSHSIVDQYRRLKSQAMLKGSSLAEDNLNKQLKQQSAQIQSEQDQLETLLKKISSKAVIESQQSELLNAIHVS